MSFKSSGGVEFDVEGKYPRKNLFICIHPNKSPKPLKNATLHLYDIIIKPLRLVYNKSLKENKIKHQILAIYFTREMGKCDVLDLAFSLKERRKTI